MMCSRHQTIFPTRLEPTSRRVNFLSRPRATHGLSCSSTPPVGRGLVGGRTASSGRELALRGRIDPSRRRGAELGSSLALAALCRPRRETGRRCSDHVSCMPSSPLSSQDPACKWPYAVPKNHRVLSERPRSPGRSRGGRAPMSSAAPSIPRPVVRAVSTRSPSGPLGDDDIAPPLERRVPKLALIRRRASSPLPSIGL